MNVTVKSLAARSSAKLASSARHGRHVWLLITLVAISSFCVPLRASVASTPPSWTPFDLPKLQQTMLLSAAGASYRIVVATPSGKAPPAGYPVIYVVDGNELTALVSEIIRINANWGIQSRVEPAVVIGIGYPTSEPVDLTRRQLDFTSPATPGHPDPDVGPVPNGGDTALMDFIDSVVKPVVEARYPIDRTRQTLLGHSLGGLFTLETLFARPRSFQTYVALSPSIWWNERTPLRQARAFLAKPGRPAKLRVFISVGDLEQHRTPLYIAHDHYDARKAFEAEGKSDAQADNDVVAGYASMDRKMMVTNANQMAALLSAGQVRTEFFDFAGEDHFSVVPAALARGVPFALGDQLPSW